MTPEEFFTHYQASAIPLIEKEGGTYSKISFTKKKYSINGFNCKWVIKQPRDISDIPQGIHSPIFACEKWNKMNPAIPAYFSEALNLWISPYLGKIHPNAFRVKTTILNVYHRTGIILAEGFMLQNFLLYHGQIYCVDMDFAIDPISPSSDWVFNQLICTRGFDEYFSAEGLGDISTKNLIKTLFYVEQELRHVHFNRALLTLWTIDKLHHFRESGYHIYAMTLEILIHLQKCRVNEVLLTPESIMFLMLNWYCKMTKQEIERELVEINVIMTHHHHEKPKQLSGFFEHLNKRIPYIDNTSGLSF